MNTRQERGRVIAEMGNQITRLDDQTYTVRSQSSSKVYGIVSTERGWTCACPDHFFRGVLCKHVHAVEISRKMREAVAKAVTIRKADLGKCKHCDSERIVRDCTRKFRKGDVQQYKCNGCGKRFVHNIGFEKKRAGPEQITQAVELVFAGLSTRKTATLLKKAGVRVSHVTVFKWADQYADLMEKYLDTITPNVGETWRTDEIYMMIRGERRYLFAMLDSETRYWIAKQVAEHKGTDDVRPMFKKAREVAGKVPEKLVSDGAGNFAEAHRDEYAAKNSLHKESEHVRHIHMAGDTNNNPMESFNGNTVRLREDATRGLKREDSPILSGLRVYHNHVKPHESLPGRITPGEAAGIKIEGNDKILTMIQAAARAPVDPAA